MKKIVSIEEYAKQKNIHTTTVYAQIKKGTLSSSVFKDNKGKKYISIEDYEDGTGLRTSHTNVDNSNNSGEVIELLKEQIRMQERIMDRLENSLESKDKTADILQKQLATSQNIIGTLERQLNMKEQEAVRLTSLVLKSNKTA